MIAGRRGFTRFPQLRAVAALALVVLATVGADRADANAGSKVFKEAAPSVVVVETDTGSGSAFGFGRQGRYLTNCHVISSTDYFGNERLASSITIKSQDGRTASATVIKADCDLDVALLSSSLTVANLASPSADPAPGETVFAIGAPLGSEWSITTGSLSSAAATPRSDRLRGRDRRLLQVDVPINKGNSGGPLLNEKAEVIGIATQTEVDEQGVGGGVIRAEGMNYGVPIGQAAESMGISGTSKAGGGSKGGDEPDGPGTAAAGNDSPNVGIWALLLLAIAGGAGWFLWRRSQQQAIPANATGRPAPGSPGHAPHAPRHAPEPDFEVTLHGRTDDPADDVEIVLKGHPDKAADPRDP